MRIYNSDGSEPEMCGNGLRCMAKFLQKLENKDGQETSYDIWTLAGMIKPKITKNGSVEVDMGLAQLKSEQIPTTLPEVEFECPDSKKTKMAVKS